MSAWEGLSWDEQMSLGLALPLGWSSGDGKPSPFSPPPPSLTPMCRTTPRTEWLDLPCQSLYLLGGREVGHMVCKGLLSFTFPCGYFSWFMETACE